MVPPQFTVKNAPRLQHSGSESQEVSIDHSGCQRTLRYGNRYWPVDQPKRTRDGLRFNAHHWEVFVEILDGDGDCISASDLISKVKFDLGNYEMERGPGGGPRSLNLSEVVLRDEPFSVDRISGGWFPIKISIYWRRALKRAPLHLKHKLGLESGGSMFFLDLLCFEGDSGLEIAPFQVSAAQRTA
jgi:hypothetical protein